MFSAGMDLGTLAGLGGDAGAAAPVPAREHRGVEHRRGDDQAASAQIHGACIGGAMELALACDLRVIAADAVIGHARDAARADPRRRRLLAAARRSSGSAARRS